MADAGARRDPRRSDRDGARLSDVGAPQDRVVVSARRRRALRRHLPAHPQRGRSGAPDRPRPRAQEPRGRTARRVRRPGHPPQPGDSSLRRPRRSPGSLRVRSDDHPPAERLRIAVMYYSARGNVHGLARDVAEGAASVGVEVRLRHVAELNQELLISAKQYWGRHRSEIEHQPDARLEDIEWADGIAFGTPTRVRQRLGAAEAVPRPCRRTLAVGGGWLTRSRRRSRPRKPSTAGRSRRLSPSTTPCATWGALIVPLGYTVHEVFNGGENPSGASFTESYTQTSVVRGIFRKKAEARRSPRAAPNCLTTRRRPGQQDEAIERYRLRSNQPGSRQ